MAIKTHQGEAMISTTSDSSGIEPHLHSRWFDATPATMNVDLEHAKLLTSRRSESGPDLGIPCCSANPPRNSLALTANQSQLIKIIANENQYR